MRGAPFLGGQRSPVVTVVGVITDNRTVFGKSAKDVRRAESLQFIFFFGNFAPSARFIGVPVLFAVALVIDVFERHSGCL